MQNLRILKDENRYKTSLMITSRSLDFIKSFKKKNGKTYNGFLNILILRNFKYLKISPIVGGKVLTEYQKKGLNLKKLNFKPRSKDWSILRTAANHYNISISLLVAILLEKLMGKEENLKKTIVQVLNINIFKKLNHSLPTKEKYLQISTIQI